MIKIQSFNIALIKRKQSQKLRFINSTVDIGDHDNSRVQILSCEYDYVKWRGGRRSMHPYRMNKILLFDRFQRKAYIIDSSKEKRSRYRFGWQEVETIFKKVMELKVEAWLARSRNNI